MKIFPLYRTFLMAFTLWLATLGSNAQISLAQSAPATTQSLQFMVVGDWGNGSEQQKNVAEAMARYAEAQKDHSPIQLVVMTGDNFYERGVESVDDPQWQQRFEQIYDAKRLPMPFIAVLGNHDWGLNPAAQIAYAGAHPGTRWQMDGFWFKRTYYLPNDAKSRVEPLVDFFFVDTDLWVNEVARLKDAQTNWLRDGLKNSRARWQIVVAHHPLYSNGEHGHDGDVLKIRELLSPMFKQWGVDAFLCGHDHDLQRIEVPEHPTLFLVSGAGGKLRKKAFDDWAPFYQATPGFAAITLTPQTLNGSFLDDKLQTLDTWQRAPVAALPVPHEAAPVVKSAKDTDE